MVGTGHWPGGCGLPAALCRQPDAPSGIGGARSAEARCCRNTPSWLLHWKKFHPPYGSARTYRLNQPSRSLVEKYISPKARAQTVSR
jgi:hypothetical protein